MERGYRVEGPVARADEALALVEREPPHAGVLDIHLGDGNSVPVAEALLRRQRPFVFVSGHANPAATLPDHLHAYPMLPKPVDPERLHATLRGFAR